MSGQVRLAEVRRPDRLSGWSRHRADRQTDGQAWPGFVGSGQARPGQARPGHQAPVACQAGVGVRSPVRRVRLSGSSGRLFICCHLFIYLFACLFICICICRLSYLLIAFAFAFAFGFAYYLHLPICWPPTSGQAPAFAQASGASPASCVLAICWLVPCRRPGWSGQVRVVRSGSVRVGQARSGQARAQATGPGVGRQARPGPSSTPGCPRVRCPGQARPGPGSVIDQTRSGSVRPGLTVVGARRVRPAGPARRPGTDRASGAQANRQARASTPGARLFCHPTVHPSVRRVRVVRSVRSSGHQAPSSSVFFCAAYLPFCLFAEARVRAQASSGQPWPLLLLIAVLPPFCCRFGQVRSSGQASGSGQVRRALSGGRAAGLLLLCTVRPSVRPYRFPYFIFAICRLLLACICRFCRIYSFCRRRQANKQTGCPGPGQARRRQVLPGHRGRQVRSGLPLAGCQALVGVRHQAHQARPGLPASPGSGLWAAVSHPSVIRPSGHPSVHLSMPRPGPPGVVAQPPRTRPTGFCPCCFN